MGVEPVVFDGDDGVAQVRGDPREWNVAPMLLEREPRLAVGAVEHRLADAARESVHREPVANHDSGGDERDDGCDSRNRENDVAPQRTRATERQRHTPIVDQREPRSLRAQDFAVVAAVTLSGRSSRPISEPCVRMTARSITCCSSRTFPGHEKLTRARSASAWNDMTDLPCCAAYFRRKYSASKGISVGRSRSAGTGSISVLMRKYRSSRSRPSLSA